MAEVDPLGCFLGRPLGRFGPSGSLGRLFRFLSRSKNPSNGMACRLYIRFPSGYFSFHITCTTRIMPSWSSRMKVEKHLFNSKPYLSSSSPRTEFLKRPICIFDTQSSLLRPSRVTLEYFSSFPVGSTFGLGSDCLVAAVLPVRALLLSSLSSSSSSSPSLLTPGTSSF